MKSILNISSLFNYLVNNTESNKLVNLLNQMLENNLLNEELYLNLIKGLILIIYLNKDCFDIYYNILHYINFKMNSRLKMDCFDKLKNLHLSQQQYISDTTIENIIIYTHNYIINDISMQHNTIDDVITNLINIITLIKKLHVSTEFKITLYLYIVKHTELKHQDINSTIDIINKFIR
jgi:hypothetical protein